MQQLTAKMSGWKAERLIMHVQKCTDISYFKVNGGVLSAAGKGSGVVTQQSHLQGNIALKVVILTILADVAFLSINELD